MSPNSTAEKPSDIGTLPLNLTGVLMFILLEAALETYYIVLWTFFFFFLPPQNSLGLELLRNRSKERPLLLELKEAKFDSIRGLQAAISALYQLTWVDLIVTDNRIILVVSGVLLGNFITGRNKKA